MTSVAGVLFDKRCDGELRTVIGLVCLLSPLVLALALVPILVLVLVLVLRA